MKDGQVISSSAGSPELPRQHAEFA
jgi:hypothetical protein